MKTRIMTAVLILFTAIAMIACEQADQSTVLTQQQNVTIRLANVADPNARTLRPDAVAPAAKYLVSLTEVSYSEGSGWADASGSENNKTDVEATIGGDGQSLTLTISDVHIGSYRVSIKGMDGNNVKVLYGESDSPLTVSPTTDGNSISITLEQVFDNTGDESLKGSVEIPLDWSAVTDDRLDEGFQIKVFDNSGNKLIATYTYDPSEGAKTCDTFTFETDVTPSRFVRFDLYEAGGSTLVSTLRRTYIWVAAGNVSRPMDGEEGIVINDMNLQLAFNIYDFKAEEIADSTTSVKLSWKSYGAGQLEKINFWYAPSNESRPGEVSFTVDGTKSEHTLGDLTEGTEYNLWYQAVYKNGMVSSIDQYQGVIKTMIYVTGIDVKASGSDSLTTSVGSEFTLSVSITPENATDKSYTFSDVSAYFDDLGNGSFKATKAGVHTIEVTANGSQTDGNVKDTIKVITRLQAPTGVTATPSPEGIEISGYKVDDAQSYDIYRNGSLLEKTLESTYLDRNVKTSEEYTYHVVAKLTEGDINLDSAASNETDAVSIKDSVISIIVPTIEEGFDIALSTSKPLYIQSGVNDYLTFSYEDAEGHDISWMLNGEEIESDEGSSGTRVTISLEKFSFYMPVNELALVISKGGHYYSNSIKFVFVVPGASVTEVSLSSANTLIITDTEDKSARSIQLKYAVTGNGAYSPVPSFQITEGMDLASIDTNGKITFNKNADGTIVVRASGIPNTDVYDEITIHAFGSNDSLATALVNEVNSRWNKAFEIANDSSHFANDWLRHSWSTLEHTIQATSVGGTSGSFFFRAADGLGLESNHGYVRINEATFDFGEIFLKGTLSSPDMEIEYNDNGTSGIGGEDTLASVGVNSGAYIQVTLPDRNGEAKIYYESVNVSENSGNYTVNFEKPIAINQEAGASSSFANSSIIQKLL